MFILVNQCRQLKQCEKQLLKKETIIRPKNYKKSLLCGLSSQTSTEKPPKHGGVRKANWPPHSITGQIKIPVQNMYTQTPHQLVQPSETTHQRSPRTGKRGTRGEICPHHTHLCGANINREHSRDRNYHLFTENRY